MRKVVLIISICLISVTSFAQNNLTLYNMEALPQRLSVNPALTPDCKFYIGMPGLSSLDFSFISNTIGLKEINQSFVEKPNGKYKLDLNRLGDFVSNETYIGIGLNEEWINFGFRARKSMITFGITEKLKTRISIPGDVLKLAFQGNGGQNLGYNFNFNFGLDVLHTREFALGYSRRFLNDKLTLGTRLKYIQGLNVINTNKNDIVFRTETNDYSYTVAADIEINSSSAFANVLDTTQSIDYVKALVGSPNNNGFGIDLGAKLDLTKRISVHASVIDLGVINWRDDVLNIKSRNPGASFNYKGIDVNEFLSDSGTSQGFQALSDTLMEIFALDSSNNGFKTGLLGEVYLGANFQLTKKHNFGVLFYGSYYNKQLYPALTLSYNGEVKRVMSLSLSYTMSRGNFMNLGTGVVFNFGPEQFYLVSDNLIGAATGNVKNLPFRFGWNHTFGRKKYEKEFGLAAKKADQKKRKAKRKSKE